MKRSSLFGLSSFVAVCTGAMVVACSAAPAPTPTKGNTKSADGTTPPPSGGSTPGATPGATPPSDSTPPSSSTTPAACATKASQTECYTCCDDANPKGADFWFTAFVNAACTTPGTCKTQCAATACAGKDPADGDACSTCLNDTDALYEAADTACAADADCAKNLSCYDTSKCDAKADVDAGP